MSPSASADGRSTLSPGHVLYNHACQRQGGGGPIGAQFGLGRWASIFIKINHFWIKPTSISNKFHRFRSKPTSISTRVPTW